MQFEAAKFFSDMLARVEPALGPGSSPAHHLAGTAGIITGIERPRATS